MSQNRTAIINTALMRVGAQGINLAFQDNLIAIHIRDWIPLVESEYARITA